jgi:ABC-type glycerol-3-phosphate transport system substrate-binding protein
MKLSIIWILSNPPKSYQFFGGLCYALTVMVLLLWSTTAHPQSGKNASPEVQKKIRVDLNQYTPGTIPMGIGEPNKVARIQADAWEEKHPGVKIILQQLINTGSTEGEFLKTQLLGGIAPEILSLNAEGAWPDVAKGWYVPLDEYLERPNPYVPGNKRWKDIFLNQSLLNAKRAGDGKLYCISVDFVETGVFYNMDLLRSVGVEELPETWEEFIDLFDRFEDSFITPMTSPYNLASDWGQDVLFEMLYHDILSDLDLLASRADAAEYLGHYLDPPELGFLFSKGFFTARDPRWREMNRILRQWRTYWAKELKNTDPIRLFLTGRMAAYWTGSWFTRRMVTDPYVDFEWDIGYIPRLTKDTSPYASGTPATVVGGAAIQLHITNSALLNDNLEECIDYLMFLSAPQQIEELASETLLFIPNVHNAAVDKRLAPFGEILKRPYCAVKLLESVEGRYKKFWRRMLDFYLHDGVDLDEFLELLEGNFSDWVEVHRDDPGWDFNAMEKVWNERAERLLTNLEGE